MKIATFNINNVNNRLDILLAWLAAAKPDVVCLQELKAADKQFPRAAIEAAGYGAVWRGQSTWNGVAILARGGEPVLTRNELPGDPSDTQSRYIEAAVNGILVASLYAPNGNPQPGPKFDYKLAWHERLDAPRGRAFRDRPAGRARRRLQHRSGTARHLPDQILRRQRAGAAGEPRRVPAPARPGLGRRDPQASIPRTPSTRSGTTGGTAGSATPACGSTTSCSARRWRVG